MTQTEAVRQIVPMFLAKGIDRAAATRLAEIYIRKYGIAEPTREPAPKPAPSTEALLLTEVRREVGLVPFHSKERLQQAVGQLATLGWKVDLNLKLRSFSLLRREHAS